MRLPARSTVLPWAALALFAGGAGALAYLGRAWSPGELVLAAGVYLAGWAVAARGAVRNLFGPVFAYELTRLGRRKSGFGVRFLYVVVVAGMLAYWFLLWEESIRWRTGGRTVVRAGELAAFATQFFVAYAVLQYAVVAVLTPVYVAGSIADEKERKTLEFLLATDLTGAEIVFGKAAARVFTLLMFVLAGLPVLAFLQLFGGIDPDLLLANTAAAVVTILGLAAVSLYFSVTQRRPREAITATYLVVAVYALASLFGGMYVKFGLPRDVFLPFTVLGATVDHPTVVAVATPITEWASAGNMVYLAFAEGRRLGGGADPAAVIAEVLGRYALFWGVVFAVLMLVAVARLRPVALRQSHGAPRRLSDRAARRRPPVGPDPVAWKEVFVDGAVRSWAGVVTSVLMAAAVFLVPVFVFFACYGDALPLIGGWFYPVRLGPVQRLADFHGGVNGWVRAATALLGFLALMGVAVRGAGALSAERDRDTWVSLIATPLSAWDIVWGKWLGAVLALRRTYAVLVGVWAVGLVTGSVEPVMLLATAASFAVYAAAFAWLGVWCSVAARTTLIATVRAVLLGLFAAGGFWLVPLFTCVLPAGLLGGRDMAVRDAMDTGATVLYGATPPLVLGFLPVQSFAGRELGPFNPRLNVLGPVAPVCGAFAWLGATWLLGSAAWRGTARQMNRRG